jgi:hypothetical protein
MFSFQSAKSGWGQSLRGSRSLGAVLAKDRIGLVSDVVACPGHVALLLHSSSLLCVFDAVTAGQQLTDPEERALTHVLHQPPSSPSPSSSSIVPPELSLRIQRVVLISSHATSPSSIFGSNPIPPLPRSRAPPPFACSPCRPMAGSTRGGGTQPRGDGPPTPPSSCPPRATLAPSASGAWHLVVVSPPSPPPLPTRRRRPHLPLLLRPLSRRRRDSRRCRLAGASFSGARPTQEMRTASVVGKQRKKTKRKRRRRTKGKRAKAKRTRRQQTGGRRREPRLSTRRTRARRKSTCGCAGASCGSKRSHAQVPVPVSDPNLRPTTREKVISF